MATATPLPIRAAELLEAEAEALHASHTVAGMWVVLDEADREARDAHDELLAIARQLRAGGSMAA